MKNNLDCIVNRVIIAANYSDLKTVDSIMHEGDFIPCKNGFIASQTLEANAKKTVKQLLEDIDNFMKKANKYNLSIFTADGKILHIAKKDIYMKKSVIDQKQIKKVLSE